MNVFLLLVIYILILIIGLILIEYFHKRIFRYGLIKKFLSPSFYYIFTFYYLLLIIFVLSILINVDGTPTQVKYYRYLLFIIAIILAILGIIYGLLWLRDVVNSIKTLK